MKTSLRILGLSALLAASTALPALAGDEIRPIELYTRPQAAQPQEFQSVELIAQEWRKLGLDVKIHVMPWDQLADFIWDNRDSWDATAWPMVGRPERSDPDELIYNLFDSATAKDGYNFIGYINPAYDKLAEAQRVETDPEKRRGLVNQAQEIVAKDQPNMLLVHPKLSFAFNQTVWDPTSVINQSGIGIRNTWTFMSLKPLGAQKDIILNSSDNLIAVNPLYISGIADAWVTELIYDRLMRVGPDGLPKPWAAESYEWKDAKTLSVKLRQGMKWHDGQPVTVEDVKFSFETAGSDMAPMYKPFATGIDSIQIVGDDEIVFKLKQPSAAFLTSSLAKINLIPEHIWKPILADLKAKGQTAESYQETTPIGSGPFKFDHWTKNEEIALSANKDYFNAPKADRWIMRIVPNVEAALGMLRSGEINFLAEFAGDPKVLASLAASDKDVKVVTSTELGFRYIAFNNRHAPFDDPAFRKALSSAVDRKLIVGAAYNGYAVPANSVISPAMAYWYDPKVWDGWQAGLDVSKAALKAAGYTVVDGHLHYPGTTTEKYGKK